MEFSVDRDLPVPLRTQLQGLIEYGIACGELSPGESLPSVRDLAMRIGVAPMTVSQVYGYLKSAGLIETRPGSGSFVTSSGRARLASRPEAAELHRRIDALIDAGIAAGVRPAELVSLVSARVFYRDSIGTPTTRIVMIGLFTDATASYARFIAARLGNGVTVEPLTIAAIEREPEARARANSADLAVTFVNRQREVMALVPNTKVVSISFIPSEETRKALASLDSLARVAVISRLPEFLPIMKAGVQRFAPHVAHLTGATLETPELDALLAASDVVVFASGADDVVTKLPAGVPAIEYRHAPDTAEIERVLVPLIKSVDGSTTSEERKAS
ncbi:hypothetical protein BH10PSE7_BH10PSE7_19100 [soil metagenome]